MNVPQDKELRLRWFRKLINPENGCINLITYVQKMFNRKLEKNQYFAIRDMLDPRIRNLYFSTARQAGKTESIAIYQALCSQFPDCVIPYYEGKGHCYVFAPKKEQAQISFERFSNLIHQNDKGVFDNTEFLSDKSDKLTFPNGFEVRAITASRNAEIEGLTTHIIILDESQAISPYKVRESILPMGGGVRGGAKIIQCGVPGILGSHFHKAFKNKYHPIDNPFGYVHHIYPWKECPRVEESYIMTLKAEDDESFERNYELSWARSNFGYFMDEDIYNSCQEDYDPLSFRKQAVEEAWEFHWGIDFAKLRDSTVLTEWALHPETGHFYLTRLIELRGVDYTEQVGYFANIFNPLEVVHCSADQTAVGEPVIELLNLKSIRTTGEIFSTQSKDKIYKNFKHVIENRKVHWPTRSSIRNNKEFKRCLVRFKQQLLELEMEYRISGHVAYHHNLDDNLARDDYADSAALGIWSAMQYVPPNVGYAEDY